MKRKLWTVLSVFAMVAALLPLSAAAALAAPGTPVFINEIHYDNAGTDTGEAVEVAGPAGTDLAGWSIVLYNGSGGAPYGTTTLSGTLADSSNGFGFSVVNYPVNGIQNGAPDGLALVDASNNVVQFLSYEGTFTAVGGPADGMTSTDIGVSETSSTPEGDSLQLTGTGTEYEDFTWASPEPSTFGAVNAGQTFSGNAAVTVSCADIITDVGTGSSSAVTASDADGIVTGLSLTVNPAPATGSISLTSITPATTIGGSATADVTVTADVPAQIYSATVTATNSDAAPQTGTCDLTVTVSPTMVTSIYDIQYTTDASGASPHVGDFVLTEGVVTAVFGSDVFIQDGTGPWSGLYVFNLTSTPSVGDQVQVVGTVSEYYGMTEITGGTATVIGAGTVPDAEVLATGDIGQEQWESVLVRAENATVVNPDLGHGEWSIDDGSGPIVVDDLGSYSYVPVAGDNVKFLQGPLNYSFSAFKIEPRDNDDLLVITPVGTIQGSVSDTDNGLTFDSAYVGDYVNVQVVVTQKVLSRTSSGSNSWGFFLQNTAATADGDPNSSDGIYLYTGRYDDIYNPAGGYYYLQVGDELIIRAQVSEYYHLTELSDASLVEVVRTDVDVNTETPAFVADPPANLDDANRYWERHEGMLAQIPSGSFALAGRDVFASTADGEVWVSAPDSPIASLIDYARRAFRDERNLASGTATGNGFRIVMGSLGLKGAAEDNTELIAPVSTFDTITNSPVGGVYFSFSKYQIQIGEQLAFTDGIDPAKNYPVKTPDVVEQYSATTFNMENLYDYRNDPFDGCDFTSDTGCPGVSPPFDYVPVSDAVYQERLGEIASQVVNDLKAPDVVLAQELEDQDICTVVDWELVCGTTNNADGKPDTLQELTTKIYAQSGVKYDTAYDRDGADDRGIVNGYMFRMDRVELLPADAANPVLGSSPTVDYPGGLAFNTDIQNPKSFNAVLPSWVDTSTGVDGDNVFTRAPLVGYFRIWQVAVGSGPYTDAYLIDNHFSSSPDARVGQRTEQANYNAAIVAALQAVDPNVKVIVGGDLNVYPDSDQLAGLYGVMTNLYYTLLAANPNAAYSYVYQGQAQTLDQLFVTDSVLSDLVDMRSAHINSDFPSDYVGDGARGTSDHDPQVARVEFTDNFTLDALEELVQHYADEGMITGRNTEKILLDRLDRAQRAMDRGKTVVYKVQLAAFILQVRAFTPRFIDRDAYDVLKYDTLVLLGIS